MVCAIFQLTSSRLWFLAIYSVLYTATMEHISSERHALSRVICRSLSDAQDIGCVFLNGIQHLIGQKCSENAKKKINDNVTARPSRPSKQ